MLNKEPVDPEAEFIKKIMMDFQLFDHENRLDKTSDLFKAVNALAEIFKETQLKKRLVLIRNGFNCGIDLFSIEYILNKSGKKTFKSKNTKKVYTRSALNYLLKQANHNLYLELSLLQKKYNVPTPEFNWTPTKTTNVEEIIKGN